MSNDSLSQDLYEKRQKIYPRKVSGIYATLRILAATLLLGTYYLVPWINWNGRQGILFDLPDRKFYLFEMVLWPQDFIYLAGLLIVAALSLFFFTALAGRLWCGYACPQTVWTELFLWIERKVEGDRNKRIRLDQSHTLEKWIKKVVKHGVWILLSAWTGYTFVGYFTPITELGSKIFALDTGPWETFWVLFYGFATYGNAGWMREQVCIYMCPYARFQSAMFDRDTLMISYDASRGDPRGGRNRKTNKEDKGLGDCIDCKLCVQVCPTGIDIRDGLQYQCIGCAACIDVCDEVMEKMTYPKGLIRYTTENTLESGQTRVIRPRIIIYGFILLALCTSLIYGLSTRTLVSLDVIRDRNVLYRQLESGDIENIYTLKVINKDGHPHNYSLSVLDSEHVTLANYPELYLQPGETASEHISAILDADAPNKKSQTIWFQLQSNSNSSISTATDARFLIPE